QSSQGSLLVKISTVSSEPTDERRRRAGFSDAVRAEPPSASMPRDAASTSRVTSARFCASADAGLMQSRPGRSSGFGRSEGEGGSGGGGGRGRFLPDPPPRDREPYPRPIWLLGSHGWVRLSSSGGS